MVVRYTGAYGLEKAAKIEAKTRARSTHLGAGCGTLKAELAAAAALHWDCSPACKKAAVADLIQLQQTLLPNREFFQGGWLHQQVNAT